MDVIVVHAPHSWDTKHQEGAEAITYAFWKALQEAIKKSAKPHATLFFLGDVNIEFSHAQVCYEGTGHHQPAKEATNYAGIFGEFLESNHLSLPCTYSKCHQGNGTLTRQVFATEAQEDFITLPSQRRGLQQPLNFSYRNILMLTQSLMIANRWL